MTRLAVVVVCLLSVHSARADEPDGPEDTRAATPPPEPQQPPPPPQPAPPTFAPRVVPAALLEEIQHLETSGRRMRVGGGLMLGLAIAAEISGQVLLLHSQLTAVTTCSTLRGVTTCSTDNHIDELAAGITLGLVGAGMIYGGYAVLAAGSGRVRRAEAMKARLQLQPELGYNRIGLRLALRF